MSIDVESLRERIASAESLHAIVETMRTLAAVNIRRAEQATRAAQEYLRSVHLALYVALKEHRADRRAAVPSRGAPLSTLLVLSSNQGLCGSFNERIVHFALAVRAREGERRGVDATELPIVCVGYRGAERLKSAGARVVAVFDAPSSVDAVGPLVREIYYTLSERFASHGSLIAVYNRPTSGSSFVESDVQLLPFEAERWRRLPRGEPDFETIPKLSGPSTQSALGDIIRELLYIDLYRILVESFAAENAARLYSMQGASENIEELLFELNASYREARQDAITNELMDILGGLLATSKGH